MKPSRRAWLKSLESVYTPPTGKAPASKNWRADLGAWTLQSLFGGLRGWTTSVAGTVYTIEEVERGGARRFQITIETGGLKVHYVDALGNTSSEPTYFKAPDEARVAAAKHVDLILSQHRTAPLVKYLPSRGSQEVDRGRFKK